MSVPDAEPDGAAELPGRVRWLPGAIACGVPGTRCPGTEFGMTAIWGAAAIAAHAAHYACGRCPESDDSRSPRW